MLNTLKSFVRDIPDFPKPGVMFRDITPLLQNTKAFRSVLDRFESLIPDCDVIAGIESRGFLFAAPLADRLNKNLVLLRKPGKLPRKTLSYKYDLEYGSSELAVHEDSICQGQRVVVMDDVLATGGTAKAACELVELAKGQVVACLFAIELKELNGRDLLKEHEILSVMEF